MTDFKKRDNEVCDGVLHCRKDILDHTARGGIRFISRGSHGRIEAWGTCTSLRGFSSHTTKNICDFKLRHRAAAVFECTTNDITSGLSRHDCVWNLDALREPLRWHCGGEIPVEK